MNMRLLKNKKKMGHLQNGTLNINLNVIKYLQLNQNYHSYMRMKMKTFSLKRRPYLLRNQ